MTPTHLVTGIAAALRFDHPDDPVAGDLRARLAEQGLARILTDVCGLPPDEPLFGMIVERYGTLAARRG